MSAGTMHAVFSRWGLSYGPFNPEVLKAFSSCCARCAHSRDLESLDELTFEDFDATCFFLYAPVFSGLRFQLYILTELERVLDADVEKILSYHPRVPDVTLDSEIRHADAGTFHELIESAINSALKERADEVLELFRSSLSRTSNFAGNPVYAYAKHGWSPRELRLARVLFSVLSDQVIIVPSGLVALNPTNITDQRFFWGAPVTSHQSVSSLDDEEVLSTLRVLAREMSSLEAALDASRALKN